MPKTAKVQFGEREYILTEKVMGVSIKWREKLRSSRVMRVFETLDGVLDQLVDAIERAGDGASNGQVRMVAGMNIATIAPALMQGLAHSVDEIIELLFDYTPELADDKEWILENAYNEEAILAFLEVLKLNFPIMALWGMVSGSRVQPTSTNLPSTNGVNGTKKHSARLKNR